MVLLPKAPSDTHFGLCEDLAPRANEKEPLRIKIASTISEGQRYANLGQFQRNFVNGRAKLFLALAGIAAVGSNVLGGPFVANGTTTTSARAGSGVSVVVVFDPCGRPRDAAGAARAPILRRSLADFAAAFSGGDLAHVTGVGP